MWLRGCFGLIDNILFPQPSIFSHTGNAFGLWLKLLDNNLATSITKCCAFTLYLQLFALFSQFGIC